MPTVSAEPYLDTMPQSQLPLRNFFALTDSDSTLRLDTIDPDMVY
jgi:hypothetical protein